MSSVVTSLNYSGKLPFKRGLEFCTSVIAGFLKRKVSKTTLSRYPNMHELEQLGVNL